ncbi:hypothetical protein [Halocola ammonii]
MKKNLFQLALTFVLLWLSVSGWSQSQSQKSLIAPADVLQSENLDSRQFESLADQWENQARANASNANAWLNWFDAERFSHYQNKMKVRTESQKQELQSIISEMSQNVPNSAQLDYARFLLDPFSEPSFQHLENAYQKSSSEEVELDYIAYLKLKNKSERLRNKLQQLATKELFSAVEMEYNRNVLVSVPKDGVLLTHGNSDTFPLLIWQELEGFRTDVVVINIEWLNNSELRKELFERLGLALPNLPNGNEYHYANNILMNEGTHPVSIALTFPPAFLQQHQNRLNCAGLVFVNQKEFSPRDLMKNWFDFQLEHFTSTKGLNANYQFPLYLLDQYLAENGPERKRKDLAPYKALFPELFKNGQ